MRSWRLPFLDPSATTYLTLYSPRQWSAGLRRASPAEQSMGSSGALRVRRAGPPPSSSLCRLREVATAGVSISNGNAGSTKRQGHREIPLRTLYVTNRRSFREWLLVGRGFAGGSLLQVSLRLPSRLLDGWLGRQNPPTFGCGRAVPPLPAAGFHWRGAGLTDAPALWMR